MKIDRRSFISLGIGASAGIALSPLPWKLQDDASIWTQNWPWTPVPADGEANYENTTCTLCPGGCGITVRKIDNRPVKIEGLKGHPVNDGGVCILGLSGLQLLNGPSRVKSPQKLVGNRGSGQYQAITWEEALKEIAGKLKDLRGKQQSHTLACISESEYGTVPELLKRFLTAYGSPNYIRKAGVLDAYELALSISQGFDARVGFDFENSDYILSFGAGLLDGWGSPVHMFKANSHWRSKEVQVVQIEPRLSNSAAKANRWIPINPGTESVLALGMAHILIKESLYHLDFVNNYTEKFEPFKQMILKDFTPQKVEAVTGVKDTTIIGIARQFGQARKPVAIFGRGRGSTPGSVIECLAVNALNALKGSINREGGFWAVEKPGYIQWPEVEMDEIASTGIAQERIDGAGSKEYPLAKNLLTRLPQVLNSGKGYPINALFVTGANPLYTLPDTQATLKAIEKIPFIVSFSSYWDETAKMADIILPNHIYLERYEDIPYNAMLCKPGVGLVRPVVAPQFDTRHMGDVIMELAKEIGGPIADAFAWESYEALLEETFGDNWETLQETGYAVDEAYQPPAWQDGFKTASQKYIFSNEVIEQNIKALPLKMEGATDKLTLIAYDSIRLSSGYIADTPFVVKTVEDTILKGKDIFVEMNPETAKQYGLKEGQYAKLTTPKGEAKVKIHLSEGLKPGLVAMPTGLGHTAYDNYIGGKGENVNKLIAAIEDPVSGYDAAWGIGASLS